MTTPLLLIGGGGHCKSYIDVIEKEGVFAIAGIVDSAKDKHQIILGYPVIGSDDELPELIRYFPNVLIAFGQVKSSARRIELFEELKRLGAKFPVIQSPLAHVSAHAPVGEGTIVMHHALINAGAKVGINCIINTKSLVEHDAVVEDHYHISTGTIVNGGVQVGTGSFLGSGSVSVEYVTIPPYSFVKAKSLVTKSL